MTPDLAEFVGYFMGDGSLHSKGLRLCVSEADTDVLARITELSETLFGLRPAVSLQSHYYEVALHCVPLTLWWEACGFDKLRPSATHTGKGYTPRVPEAIRATNDPAVYGAFLRGLFEADGTVTLGAACWSTVNRGFSDHVKQLLMALGIPTSTKQTTSGWGKSDIFVVRVRNAAYARRFLDAVGFIGARKRSAVAFNDSWQGTKGDCVFIPDPILRRALTENRDLAARAHLYRGRHEGAISRATATALLERTQLPELNCALEFFYDAVAVNDDGGEQLTYDLSVPANVTYIANGFISHNTIGLVMDCDTTGIEPDFALVKFKKLAGGGYFKIVNQSVAAALRKLGYSREQIEAIETFAKGTGTLEGRAAHQPCDAARQGLRRRGARADRTRLTRLVRVGVRVQPVRARRRVLHHQTRHDRGAAERLQLLDPARRARLLAEQIDEASDVICGRMTVEGAPYLKDEHLAVFDCATPCGKHGSRYIRPLAHVDMMAAAQPFISGGISKTINLPQSATIADVKEAYRYSWQRMVKASRSIATARNCRSRCSSSYDLGADVDDEAGRDCSSRSRRRYRSRSGSSIATSPSAGACRTAAAVTRKRPSSAATKSTCGPVNTTTARSARSSSTCTRKAPRSAR